MPVVNTSILGVADSFTRPMLYDIIRQVQKVVKISDAAHIFYPSGIEQNPTPKSNIDQEQDRRARYNNDRYLYIEVEEAYDEEDLGSASVNQRENVVIFHDPEVDVAMWPIYMSTNYVINFRYQTPSKAEADRWMADMRMKVTQLRETPLHSIEYNYAIPTPYLELIETIRLHKARLEPTIGTFEEYLKANSTNRLKLIADQTGKNTQYVIGEKQSRIVGQFDTTPLPEKIEREADSGGWICTFRYKFSVSKPDGVGCRYPIMVYNRLLDDQYIAFRTPNYEADSPTTQIRTTSMHALSMFESDRQLTDNFNIYLPYQLPRYDEFTAKISVRPYAIAISVLVEVDEDDPHAMFNLTDLDPFEIDPDILEFIQQSERPYLSRQFMSVLHLGLFRNYKPHHSGTLQVSPTLDVRSTLDLSPKQIHHVTLGVATDLSVLHQSAIDRLKKFPKAFAKMVGLINEALRDHPDLQVLSKKSVVTSLDFEKFFRFWIPGNAHAINNIDSSSSIRAGDLRYSGNNTSITGSIYRTLPTDPRLISLQHSRQTLPYIPGPARAFPNEVVRGNFMGFKTTQLSGIITIRQSEINNSAYL